MNQEIELHRVELKGRTSRPVERLKVNVIDILQIVENKNHTLILLPQGKIPVKERADEIRMKIWGADKLVSSASG